MLYNVCVRIVGLPKIFRKRANQIVIFCFFGLDEFCLGAEKISQQVKAVTFEISYSSGHLKFR